MIKPLTSDGGKHPNSYDFMDKINELVDAVNALQSGDKTKPEIPADQICDVTAIIERLKRTWTKFAPKMQYAEQRKWIGKLCRFWNDEDHTEIYYEVLTCITRKGLYYTEGLGETFDNCEPITADDELIYKGK